MADETTTFDTIELATELTIAWLGNPNTRSKSDEVPAFLSRMHDAVLALSRQPGEETPQEASAEYTPATTIRQSLASKDHIISLIDGKPYKALRRHLSTHGLTPTEYRQRYKLKPDYPVVAPNYSEARRSMAQKIGLGRKGGLRSAPSASAEPTVASPAARTRKPKGMTTTGKTAGRRGRPPKSSPGDSSEDEMPPVVPRIDQT